jgi:gluconate 2-dehydrogenase gamma chain
MAEAMWAGPAGRNSQKISRRSLLHRCAICLGVINLPQAWMKLLAAPEMAHHDRMGAAAVTGPVPFKYFTPEQAACVEAITEQIIPADQDPGAKWAGVVHYIDLSLAGEFAELRPIYQAGLSRLWELTKAVSDRPFCVLEFAQQTSILEKLQADAPGTPSGPSGQDYFALVRRQTIEGFFGDSKYGGNRDYVGWKVLKFEPG